VLVDEGNGGKELPLATEERRGRGRKVDAAGCPERRKLPVAELG